MGRSPCCSKVGLNRGAWTALEDKTLKTYIKTHGEGKWRNLPKRAGLKRCGKSCRLRWLNYLRPGIKRGNISGDEEELIIRLHKLLGNRWSLIAGRLPGRTDNEIKNYWNTTLGKKIGAHSSSSSKPTQKAAASKNSRSSRANNKKTVAATIVTSNEHDNPTHEQANRHPPGPQPIKTKAFRCTKQVFTSTVPFINPALTSSSPSTSDDPNNHFADMEAATILQSYLLTSNNNNTSAEGGDSDNSMANTGMDFLNFGSDHSLLFDKPVLQEWSRNYGLDEDENGTMDLGSFSFLLDCEGWPLSSRDAFFFKT